MKRPTDERHSRRNNPIPAEGARSRRSNAIPAEEARSRRNTEARRPNNNQRLKKYRKPLNINIGIVIFAAIFIYMAVFIFMYFRSGEIKGHLVMEGSLSTNSMYRGIAIRDEIVVPADTAGYLNYYAREGERAAKGDLIYTVDETGRLREHLESASMGENVLSDRELAEFRNEIVNFMHNFNPMHFSPTYEFKYTLKGTVLKLANRNMMEGISGVTSNMDMFELINFNVAQESGIVAYWIDGYEDLTAEMVTEEILSGKGYEKKHLIGNELIAIGDAAYKLSINENWSIVIPIDPDEGRELEEEGFVRIRFLKNQHESWAEVKLLYNGDGKTYLQLSFTNSMLTFISDRFLDVELILHDERGLKIPNSSIVQKDFFLVPEGFVTQGGNTDNKGVIRQRYLEDGTLSSEFVETGVYNYDEDEMEYYVDANKLNVGDIIIQPESQATYTVSRKSTLIGVYNMNKGYADFRQINILYQNEEYAIVQSNTRYGLNVYDYIVLNADLVSDDQFVYE